MVSCCAQKFLSYCELKIHSTFLMRPLSPHQNIQTSYIIDSLPKKFFEGQQNVIILLIDSGWTHSHHKNTLCSSQMKKRKPTMTRRMIETLKIDLIFECLVLDFCEKLSLLQLDSLQKLHLILSLADGLGVCCYC